MERAPEASCKANQEVAVLKMNSFVCVSVRDSSEILLSFFSGLSFLTILYEHQDLKCMFLNLPGTGPTPQGIKWRRPLCSSGPQSCP